MNYAILRVQKLKTNTEVRGSLRHAFRAQDTPNADPSREHENTHSGADSVEEAMKAYKARLPEKVRKNGVRCIEYLMTASPEKMNELSRDKQDAYFEDALEWLKEKHGAENVVYSGIHRDETTPHMYAYVVPLSQEKDQDGKLVKPGKLNCREFLGGTKHVLSELQTDFAENIGKKHGLDRGIKGSKAKHQTIQQYYTKLNSAKQTSYEMAKPRMIKKGFIVNKIESKEQIIDRISDSSAAIQYRNSDLQRIQKQDAKTIEALNSQLESLKPVRDLHGEERQEILDKALELKTAKQLKKQAEKQRDSEGR